MTTSRDQFRLDATALLVHQRLIDIQHIDKEDEITDEDVQLIGDFESEDGWMGNFEIEDDAEKMYQVSYRHATGKFYITEFIMFRCLVVDPDQVLYSE